MQQHEAERFSNEKTFNPCRKDIIKWWIDRKNAYPSLFKLAMDYLGAPASSVPAERANSLGRLVYENREQLSDATFKVEICINSWVKLFELLNVECPPSAKDYLRNAKVDWAVLAEEDEAIEYLLKEVDYLKKKKE